MQFLLYALNPKKISKVDNLLYVFMRAPLFGDEVQVVMGRHSADDAPELKF